MARGLHVNISAVDRSAKSEELCEGTEVFRYIGWLEQVQSEGTPWLLIQSSPEDNVYVDKIVTGKEAHPDVNQGPAGKMGELWPQGSGGFGQSSQIHVPFAFSDALVSPLARETFSRAAKEFSYRTKGCIHFVEDANGDAPLKVKISDPEKCGTQVPGYPGAGKTTQLDLGACHDQRSLDRMVHAMAAVLGFNAQFGGQGGLSDEHAKEIFEAYHCTVTDASLL